jgi:hypothetical protein
LALVSVLLYVSISQTINITNICPVELSFYTAPPNPASIYFTYPTGNNNIQIKICISSYDNIAKCITPIYYHHGPRYYAEELFDSLFEVNIVKRINGITYNDVDVH